MKAVVDSDKCIGCSLCVQICAEVFRMEEDKAVVYITPVPQEFEQICKDAAGQCPVEAISIE